MCFYDKVSASVAWIREKTEQIPELGVILGSGLGGLADELEERVVIPYGEIPNFPRSQVEGHAGNLVIGSIGGKTVAALQGRFHYYEGFSMKEVTFPVYVLRLLGVRDLIVTNACGGINRSFAPGDLMLVTDYINMLGQNSLMGDNDPRFGPRFPDMSEPYAAKWIRLAERVAEEWAIPYQKGVYALFPAPAMKRQPKSGPTPPWAPMPLACPRCPRPLRPITWAWEFWVWPASPTWQQASPKKSTPMRRYSVWPGRVSKNSASGSDSCCCNGRGIRKRRERRRFPAKLVTKE